MRKLVILAAAAAAAASAMADGVTSGNVVGYQKVTLDKQFTILGVNFTSVTNEGAALTIQDAVPYVEGMATANNKDSADLIKIQNANGAYDTYYISNGKNGRNKTVAGLEHKWAEAGTYVPATTAMPAGTAFWFYRHDASAPLTVTIAGGVSKIGSYDKQIDGAFKLVANPYPTDLPLNDGVPYVEGMTTANNKDSADLIKIQNATGTYDTYYISNGKNGRNKTVAGLEHKWAEAGTYTPTDVVIPAGQGAWFCRKGEADFDVTVARPYEIR